jgi:hypothetical protein
VIALLCVLQQLPRLREKCGPSGLARRNERAADLRQIARQSGRCAARSSLRWTAGRRTRSAPLSPPASCARDHGNDFGTHADSSALTAISRSLGQQQGM